MAFTKEERLIRRIDRTHVKVAQALLTVEGEAKLERRLKKLRKRLATLKEMLAEERTVPLPL